MRRKDREITDDAQIDEIILQSKCVHLGLNDNGKVYIVPLNFGFESKDGKRSFFFHSAKEGRKIDILRENPDVGFELDSGFELIPGDVACDYSARYKSVIGEGRVSFIEDKAEKRLSLQKLMKVNTGRSDWNIPDLMLNSVCVFRLDVETISCKVRK